MTARRRSWSACACTSEKTEPLAGFYRGRRLLTDVDGMGDVNEVAERIDQALGVARAAQGKA